MKLKNYILVAAGLILLAIILIVPKGNIVKAATQFLRSGVNASQMRTSSSTTTPVYLTADTAATNSSYIFSSGDLRSVSVFVQYYGTSSRGAFNSVLQIDRQGSDDGIDWFNYDTSNVAPLTGSGLATTTFALASTSQSVTWLPSTLGATTTKVFDLKVIPARFTKLTFSLVSSTTGATQLQSASLWVNLLGVSNNF